MQVPLMSFQDNLYHVIRLIPLESQIDMELFKAITGSTNVFKKDGMYWFVRLIKDAEIIEEPVIEEQTNEL